MHFFSTSAQIANDFEIDHEIVVETIKDIPYADFVSDNIQMFDIGAVTLAQMTEPGYNAVVFHLPISDNEDLNRWRVMFFSNKAPNLNAPASPVQTTASTGTKTRSQVDEETRRKAEEAISGGVYDNIISGSFADLHRQLKNDFGNDPGYQNSRAYAITRRAAIGVNV